MSGQSKTLIIVYATICFLFSFVFGIIGHVSFGMILLRSVLYTLLGGGIVFAIIKLLIPISFASVSTAPLLHKEESVESPLADDTYTLDSDDDDMPTDTGEIMDDITSNMQGEIETSRDIQSADNSTLNTPSTHPPEERTEGNPFDSKDKDKDVEKFDEFKSDYDDKSIDSFDRMSSSQFTTSNTEVSSEKKDFVIKDEKVSGEIKKTMQEYNKSPKNVSLAVASWMKNKDNSK